jgi:hypothetical protein
MRQDDGAKVAFALLNLVAPWMRARTAFAAIVAIIAVLYVLASSTAADSLDAIAPIVHPRSVALLQRYIGTVS